MNIKRFKTNSFSINIGIDPTVRKCQLAHDDILAHLLISVYYLFYYYYLSIVCDGMLYLRWNYCSDAHATFISILNPSFYFQFLFFTYLKGSYMLRNRLHSTQSQHTPSCFHKPVRLYIS